MTKRFCAVLQVQRFVVSVVVDVVVVVGSVCLGLRVVVVVVVVVDADDGVLLEWFGWCVVVGGDVGKYCCFVRSLRILWYC